MNELDEIMSGAGETVSASTEPMTTEAPAPVEPAGGPIRDEAGRFASQQQPQDGAGAVSTEPPVTEPHNAGNGIPVAAVQAEREKRKQAESALEEMRREMAELRGTVTALRQPVQPQQKEVQAPATIWDNPDEFVKSQLSPIEQKLMAQQEFLSETLAVQAHGAETVEAAKKAIEAAAQTPQGQSVIQEMLKSRHPFDELVKWHKQQSAIERVGSDPDAWLNAEIEKRLADPTFLAQAVERARASASAPVPGRSAAPITNLPPSLSRMPGGANAAADNDTSDAALFSNALR